jgi:hypothetical protein
MSIQVPAEKGVVSTPFFFAFFSVLPHSQIFDCTFIAQAISPAHSKTLDRRVDTLYPIMVVLGNFLR